VFSASTSFLGYEKNLGLPFLIGPGLALFVPWITTCVAELNRTPFDFAEGESELVSGFNIEYGSVKFAMIFMAEYGIIYILSLLTAFLFFAPSAHFHGAGGLAGVTFYVYMYLASCDASAIPLRPLNGAYLKVASARCFGIKPGLTFTPAANI